jgi:hypothetical protein
VTLLYKEELPLPIYNCPSNLSQQRTEAHLLHENPPEWKPSLEKPGPHETTAIPSRDTTKVNKELSKIQ